MQRTRTVGHFKFVFSILRETQFEHSFFLSLQRKISVSETIVITITENHLLGDVFFSESEGE